MRFNKGSGQFFSNYIGGENCVCSEWGEMRKQAN